MSPPKPRRSPIKETVGLLNRQAAEHVPWGTAPEDEGGSAYRPASPGPLCGAKRAGTIAHSARPRTAGAQNQWMAAAWALAMPRLYCL